MNQIFTPEKKQLQFWKDDPGLFGNKDSSIFIVFDGGIKVFSAAKILNHGAKYMALQDIAEGYLYQGT